MLTTEENELFTEVGPQTPVGKLMRWYWHPIAAATQLDENPVKRVKLLGESLVLYRDRSGKLGLIGDTCAHRSVNLAFGIPEVEGLRCPYHGWRYDSSGQCTEMPEEGKDSTFPGRVKIPAYPVKELAGLVFAYLGSEPAPLLPNWDLFVTGNVMRDVGIQVLDCNWLQVQENDMDPAHLEWLHGHFSNYALERLGRPDLQRHRGGAESKRTSINERRDWAVYEQGIMNYAKTSNGLREVRPSIFPNVNSFATDFMYRVPMDDSHTMHVFFTIYPQDPKIPTSQEKVPYYTIPSSVDREGNPIWMELDNNGGQDSMVWVTQGSIVDRTKETLGESDRGILMFRDLLRQQIQIVEDGGEPMNVFRDPAQNACILVPPRDGSPLEQAGPNSGMMNRVTGPYKHSPIVRAMVEKHKGKEALKGPVHSEPR
ncbi:MAG: Rieske 2Fe-2S domain-containing protein [Chloroflexota bacterium]|nr:Rieske 2Fe-2S domain-containing protein [Chloroflexota bacterium]